MSATVAMEGEINSIVREYLKLSGFEHTVNTFDSDCLQRGIPVASNDSHGDENDNSSLLNDFMRRFKNGEDESFFKLWMERIPDELRNKDSVAQKLEFYINIYFAIYPLKHNLKDCNDKMKKLQNYLSTKGETLSKAPELSTFFALPFVNDPKNHSTFKDLFADKWSQSLESRVRKFIYSVLQSSPTPRIFQIYNSFTSSNKVIENMSQELLIYRQKLSNNTKLFNKTKLDYNNLLDVTADIINTLESCVQGVPVTPEYIQKLYEKLFSNQLRQTTDFTRPGTASRALRESINVNKNQNGSNDSIHSINFDKLKSDIVNLNDRQKAFILQSLRWRLSKSSTASNLILNEYVKNDIFGCSGDEVIKNLTIGNLCGDNLTIRLYTIILLNLISAFNQGRIYLMQDYEIIVKLIEIILSGEGEICEREHIISLLQKLSLCNSMQLLMIERGMIEFCVKSLQNFENLTEITIDYTLALLMNLSLRTKGKQRCVKIGQEMLCTLMDLMKMENLELESQGYINGILYALCALPEMRNKARELGMVKVLKDNLKPERGEMNSQIEYLIRTINSEVYKTQEDSEHEDDCEDFDVESLEKLDLSPDDEMLRTRPGELCGEAFLEKYCYDSPIKHSEYTAPTKKLASNENILTRPATPRKSTVHGEITLEIKNVDKLTLTQVTTDKEGNISKQQNTMHSAKFAAKNNRSPNTQNNELDDDLKGFQSRPRVMRTPEPVEKNQFSKTTPRYSHRSPTKSYIESYREI